MKNVTDLNAAEPYFAKFSHLKIENFLLLQKREKEKNCKKRRNTELSFLLF